MKKTIGILAHVDAGKTTFSEQLLYCTGSISNLGRVDHMTSHMDTDEIEIKRGITIFADQAVFEFNGDTYYLIDTPGHVDFSAETERAIQVLDYAILLISGSSGVQSHTATLFRLLKSYGILTFIFINKSDIESFNLKNILDEIQKKLTGDILYIDSIEDIISNYNVAAEFVAERDDDFLESYLMDNFTTKNLQKSIIKIIKEGKCYPVMSGSALKGIGIDRFLNVFSFLSSTDYEKNIEDLTFKGKVFKIRHDEKGNRLTFIKALSGKLQIKDELNYEKNEEKYAEKVNEIRLYNGKKYNNANVVCAGDVFAAVGLKSPICGSLIENNKIDLKIKDNYHLIPALQSKVKILDNTDITVCMNKLRILEQEDPMLSINFQEETKDILISVMGKIQLEILQQIILTRFGISVEFEKPQIQYRETILSPVIGYGHFEPLRHYAEVQLRLEPDHRGSGVVFENECHVDDLGINYQRLIESHVFEKAHRGILTGSPITDIKITLLNGRAHIKHTEGGDFREATYRAIRQGLEKSKSILLEPYYSFEIYIEEKYLGKVMSDIQKLRGICEAPIQNEETVYIKGKGPVETFMDYGSDLTSFTKGNGSISLMFDCYDICQDSNRVIREIAYDKERDVDNKSSSVFCAKGTSFTVPWHEAENYMHT